MVASYFANALLKLLPIWIYLILTMQIWLSPCFHICLCQTHQQQAINNNSHFFLLTNMVDGLHPIPLDSSLDIHGNYCGNGKSGNGREGNMTKTESKDDGNFGYQLHIKMEKGKCDSDGLLLCYPSLLDALGGLKGLKFAKKFTLTDSGNGIRNDCAEKQTNAGLSKVAQWHGIRVKKEGILGSNLTLELSFSNRLYRLTNISTFSIQLGNAFTGLQVPKNQMHIEYGNWQNADDESGLEAKFFAQMPSGAMMDDFAGIWALGMDLLLSAMEKGQIDFYVYRSCNCSMNAWFGPSASPAPDDLAEIEYGSNSCPPSVPVEEYVHFNNVELSACQSLEIEASAKSNVTRRVDFFLMHKWTDRDWDKYITDIIDEELNPEYAHKAKPLETWRKYKNGFLMNISVFLEEDRVEFISPGKALVCVSDIMPKLKSSNEHSPHFTLLINVHQFHLDIFLNGFSIAKNYWYSNWLQRINSLDIMEGHFLKIREPKELSDCKVYFISNLSTCICQEKVPFERFFQNVSLG